ncbi:MAG: hypothetical protein AAF799_43920 [Myxococcota bacterium]
MAASFLLAVTLGLGFAGHGVEPELESDVVEATEAMDDDGAAASDEAPDDAPVEDERSEAESEEAESSEPADAAVEEGRDTEPPEVAEVLDDAPSTAEPVEPETADVEEPETEREEDARTGSRRGRRRNRERPDEGQWQVFAPYPELGIIRYRDPELRRTLWLGADVSGAYVPQSWGLFSRRVWALRPAGAWALSLTPWMAIGGRHGMAWYDASNIRVRVHDHQVELSGRPWAASRRGVSFDDRLAVGVTTHSIAKSDVDGVSIAPGGLRDTIIHLGYGLDHLLGIRWRLGWNVQGRYAWVYLDTQRHARASVRLAFHPRPAHRIAVDAVGFYVHRDPDQAGNRLPRHSVYGQFGLGYAWVSQAGVGPWVRARVNTGFMSGEAPVYEIREEALNTTYGEALVGILARWP